MKLLIALAVLFAFAAATPSDSNSNKDVSYDPPKPFNPFASHESKEDAKQHDDKSDEHERKRRHAPHLQREVTAKPLIDTTGQDLEVDIGKPLNGWFSRESWDDSDEREWRRKHNRRP